MDSGSSILKIKYFNISILKLKIFLFRYANLEDCVSPNSYKHVSEFYNPSLTWDDISWLKRFLEFFMNHTK